MPFAGRTLQLIADQRSSPLDRSLLPAIQRMRSCKLLHPDRVRHAICTGGATRREPGRTSSRVANRKSPWEGRELGLSNRRLCCPCAMHQIAQDVAARSSSLIRAPRQISVGSRDGPIRAGVLAECTTSQQPSCSVQLICVPQASGKVAHGSHKWRELKRLRPRS